MKKIVLLLTSLVSFSAMAGEYVTVTADPSIRNETINTEVQRGLGLTFGTVQDAWDYSAKVNTAYTLHSPVADETAINGEVRAQYNLMGFYARGGLGRMYPEANRSSYTYYTYAGGYQIEVNQDIKAFGEIEQSNAMRAGNPKYTGYTVGLRFDVTKEDQVGVSFIRKLGGVDTSGMQVGYTRSF